MSADEWYGVSPETRERVERARRALQVPWWRRSHAKGRAYRSALLQAAFEQLDALLVPSDPAAEES